MNFLEEFRASAIPDRLTLANVEWVEGDKALQIITETAIAQVQKNTSYLTERGKRILERYQFIVYGAWLTYGSTIDGGEGTSPYLKPIQPRREFCKGKIKTIPYETAQGCLATPLLPFVDPETAQQIYDRYGVMPLEGEPFWRVVQRCNLPIAITEGLKKALSLIAHGLPAIAIRGIACWHKKGTRELHEAIQHFVTQARIVYLVFDQDEKPSTRRNVRVQISKLGNVLEENGCKAFVPLWDRSLGKGIDDALMGQAETAQVWLDNLLKQASSLKSYKQDGRIAAALATIDCLNQLSYPVERKTEGEYLPELPPLEQGKIHVISTAMYAGKTTRIGIDWVKPAIDHCGWNVLVLTSLNSLGRQTARELDLPHIHNFSTSLEQQRALWAEVHYKHGIVMCPHSLHRLPNCFWERPLLLVLDESNQDIGDLCEGNTLGNRQGDILERFSAAACHALQAGAIVLAEDGLPDRAVKFIETVTNCDPRKVRVFQHQKQGVSWSCKILSGHVSGFHIRLLEAIQRGERVLIVTSSQREAKRLEKVIRRIAPSRLVVRIDSETNQQGAFNDFFEFSDHWLTVHQPDVLILSPSAKSGLSIQGGVSAEDAYFSSVWGYFPALATDTHMQLLGRYRPPVPRFIFIPSFILPSGDEFLYTSQAIKRRLRSNQEGMAREYSLTDLLQAEGDRAENLIRIETAVLDYIAESRIVSKSQKSIARLALVQRLKAAGHIVISQQVEKDDATTKLWKQVQEEIWHEEAAAIAAAQIEPDHTPEWACKELDSLGACLETRILARKVLWREEFPGVTFDDAEECYQAVCRNYGTLRRGVLLQARAENLEAAREVDRPEVKAILTSKIRAPHRLPKNYREGLLITKTNILVLLAGQPYSNSDPRAAAVKKVALQLAGEIFSLLRLQIKPDQTPIEICNKLLRKLGLKPEAMSRPGSRNMKRERVYQVNGQDNAIRIRLLESVRCKFSSSVSTIRNRNHPFIQMVDTPLNSPPDLEVISQACREDLQQFWRSCQSEDEKIAFWQVYNEVRRQSA